MQKSKISEGKQDLDNTGRHADDDGEQPNLTRRSIVSFRDIET